MAEYKYTPADFKSDQEVRWCPGCGDHAILSAVQRALPEIADATDTPHNLFTFVSGIGCSSRFIYYMKTYGFHSVHGRANAVATGVKVANPRLSVWVTTGDGDSLAIGGNHFIHAIRRNVDLNVILFNNEIYGLTKGQYSPTSKLGKITKTSPYGTVEKPFNPGELVIGAKGTFFARSVDMEVQLSKECMVAAAMHKGMSVIEVLQNCVIFNDKTHAAFAADKATRAERTITLRHGGKMLFGANMEKGIVFEDMKLKVVTVGQDGYTLDDLLAVLSGQKEHTPRKQAVPQAAPPKVNLLVDIQAKLQAGKGAGYARWAKVFNLKQIAQTLNYLSEHGLLDYADLETKTTEATARYNKLSDQIKTAEKRMAEIAVLRTHIVNYAKTHETYVAYRKAGYSKKFRQEHEEEILLHQAAKEAFNELNVKKLPTIKELQTEYAQLLADKKKAYGEYRQARAAMRELLTVKNNVDRVLGFEAGKQIEKERDQKQNR